MLHKFTKTAAVFLLWNINEYIDYSTAYGNWDLFFVLFLFFFVCVCVKDVEMQVSEIEGKRI